MENDVRHVFSCKVWLCSQARQTRCGVQVFKGTEADMRRIDSIFPALTVLQFRLGPLRSIACPIVKQS